MVLNIVFNVLSAILNLFSFALIIPILQILFKMDEGNYTFMDWNFERGKLGVVESLAGVDQK